MKFQTPILIHQGALWWFGEKRQSSLCGVCVGKHRAGETTAVTAGTACTAVTGVVRLLNRKTSKKDRIGDVNRK
jgi:hypothetical protein